MPYPYNNRRVYQRGRYQSPYGGGYARQPMRYPQRRYSNRGQYTLETGPWANRGAMLGGGLARAFRMPSELGSWIGRRLFHYPAKWFGSGRYQRRASGRGAYQIGPSGNTNQTLQPEIPAFSNADNDSTVIAHREYIGDIITSSTPSAFSIQEFIINPGDPTTFPWLSELCQTSFQQYKFEGCIFEFKSASANALNSTNTALGSVISAVNYDSADPSFGSRMQMENTSWANSCKPSNNMTIPIETHPKQTASRGLLYIANNGVLPQGTDPKTYHLGILSIATVGFQGASVNIGSLYVTYKTRLYKPIMLAPLSNGNRMLFVRTGATTAAPMGTATLSLPAQQCDTLGITFTNTVIVIPRTRLQIGQRFLVTFQWIHDSGASTPPGVGYTAGATPIAYFGPLGTDTFVSWPTPTGTVQTESGTTSVFEIVDDSVSLIITLAGQTLPANATLNISIVQLTGTPSVQLGIFVP